MNERIRELAEQQGLTGPNYLISSRELEKFAELIVNKCAMIGNYAHDGGEYPGRMIKEYFGVES